jgi:hypothetical protein
LDAVPGPGYNRLVQDEDPLQKEQDAFEAAREELLEDHEGEFVVFKDQRPVGFYSSFKEAYSRAIDLFGLESVFLVSEVRRQVPGSALLSWDLAVL